MRLKQISKTHSIGWYAMSLQISKSLPPCLAPYLHSGVMILKVLGPGARSGAPARRSNWGTGRAVCDMTEQQQHRSAGRSAGKQHEGGAWAPAFPERRRWEVTPQPRTARHEIRFARSHG